MNPYPPYDLWFRQVDERVRRLIRAGALLRRPNGRAIYCAVEIVGPTPFARNGAIKLRRLDQPREVLVSYRDVRRMIAWTVPESA